MEEGEGRGRGEGVTYFKHLHKHSTLVDVPVGGDSRSSKVHTQKQGDAPTLWFALAKY